MGDVERVVSGQVLTVDEAEEAGAWFEATTDLTPRQKAFVQAYFANGCKWEVAAAEAGYSDVNLAVQRLTRNDVVMSAIYHADDRLAVLGRSRARAAALRVLDNELASASAVVAAARLLSDMADNAEARIKAQGNGPVIDDLSNPAAIIAAFARKAGLIPPEIK